MSRPFHAANVPLALCALVALAPVCGCASFWSKSNDDSLASRPSPPSKNYGVRQASAEEPLEKTEGLTWSDFSWDNLGKTSKRLTGRGPDKNKARELYREAVDLFQQANNADPRRK